MSILSKITQLAVREARFEYFLNLNLKIANILSFFSLYSASHAPLSFGGTIIPSFSLFKNLDILPC